MLTQSRTRRAAEFGWSRCCNIDVTVIADPVDGDSGDTTLKFEMTGATAALGVGKDGARPRPVESFVLQFSGSDERQALIELFTTIGAWLRKSDD